MSEVVNTITPPDWVDKAFIENALRKGMKEENLTIHTLDIKPATAVGDNYASQMFRATMQLQKKKDGPSENMSVVIKSLPLGKMAETMAETKFFDIEGLMFNETLPALNTLIRTKYPTHEDLNAACFFHQGTPKDLLILEDLKEAKYTLGDRFGGLNLEHITVVLNHLATFHASSLIYSELEPKIKEQYKDTIWCEKHDALLRKFIKEGVVHLADLIITWEDFPDRVKYSEEVRELSETVMNKMYNIYRREEHKLNTLVHGDCWINNMMFKYEGGRVIGLKFVDFQLSTWNSPALDLNYFIFTSVKSDIREKHLEGLLEIYYKRFNSILTAFEHPCSRSYTLQNLISDFYDKLLYGFVSIATIYPITVCPPKDVIDVNDLLDEESKNSTEKMYKTEILKNVYQKAIPYFTKKGIFK